MVNSLTFTGLVKTGWFWRERLVTVQLGRVVYVSEGNFIRKEKRSTLHRTYRRDLFKQVSKESEPPPI